MGMREDKNKGHGKAKAIISIALAAIMLASVFGALAPTSARDGAGAIERGDVVFCGERGLDVSAIITSGGIFYGMADTTADGEVVVVADNTDFDVPQTVKEGPYNVTTREGTVADMYVVEPEINGDVRIEGTYDSIVGYSVPIGTKLTIRVNSNFGGMMKNAIDGSWSKVKIRLIDPYGIYMTKTIDADAVSIDVTSSEWPQLDTTDWKVGEWKVKITTDKATCNDVDISSPYYEFTVQKYELSIEAEENTVCRGEYIILRVSGYPSYYYYLIVTDVDPDKPPAIKDVGDVRALDVAGDAYPATGTPNLAAWIKTGSDGIADVAIDTTGADERTYTIKVYDATTPAYPDFAPDSDVVSEYDDDVDVTVVKPEVSFDIPTSATVGETVKIQGCISAGDRVDILIDNGDVAYEDDEPVDVNNEFEVYWDTAGVSTGLHIIDAYIDCPYDSYDEIENAGIDEDGSTMMILTSPALTAEQLRNIVAEGDDYAIEGTATGVDDVDIVLIGPDGYPLGETSLGVEYGLEITSASVTDSEFSEDVVMIEGTEGTWKTLVFSPGRDGEYGFTGLTSGELYSIIVFENFTGKTQTQIEALLKDLTVWSAGSDDLMENLSFDVENPYVRFDPIEDVIIGESLEITGKTNREPGTAIAIWSIEGPQELPPVITEVGWPTPDQGIFNATIDTSNVVQGDYTLEANDGDGNNDTATVEILETISIFDTGLGTYPSISGTHNGTITPSYTINVSKLYTYSCIGTGGHTKSIELFENDTLIANGTWNGYTGDWHNITIHNVTDGTPYVTLLKNREYRYVIKTGSYPQIIHEHEFNATGGTITCTDFTDANSNIHYDGIPAIKLFL